MFDFFITKPLGMIIKFIYDIVQNYGWSIVIFTVIVKLITLPLQYKSQKSMKKQQKIQPIIAELQQKYANDKEKLQTEMLKVYKENNVSMAGGCLPMLIQLPIMYGLYKVIQRPLNYVLGIDFKSAAHIDKISQVVKGISNLSEEGKNAVAAIIKDAPDKLALTVESQNQFQFLDWTRNLGDAFREWVINFDFFGVDLLKIPSEVFFELLDNVKEVPLSSILVFLVPIIAVLTTWLSSKQMQKMNGQKNTDAQAATSMTKTMNLMMPVLTGIFTITLPGAFGIYWIVSNLVQMLSQYVLNKVLDKKEDDFVVKIPEKNRNNRKKRK